ncbi:MAG TPA: hypothetical protein VJ646_19445 [Candidatus Binatia bacterium]|nr:hypothetical protein [Candidatus Binatia bacterium]
MTKLDNLRRARRAISQFHESERIIAWVQKQAVVVWLTPSRRRTMLFVAAIVIGLMRTFRMYAEGNRQEGSADWLPPLMAFPLLFGLMYLLYLIAVNFRKLPSAIRRRPQICLHLLFWTILALLWFVPDDGEMWREVLVLVAISLPFLIWRCGYMLMSGQRGKSQDARFRDHLFYLWPVWGGPNTPIGKGLDYLSQREAGTPESYSRSVLAAIKLMALVALIELATLILGATVYADPDNPLTRMIGILTFGLPHLKDIVTGRTAASRLTTWVSLYIELISDTLKMAARGHKWIAALRALGFNVFRNTYKPLLAESIVDFWSRYYYYFKELLLEFFFFPTYLRYFRQHPKLRMLVAVFAAALVGNMYYHLLQGGSALAAGRVVGVVMGLSPRLIYCFLLASGIYFSMLRQQRRRGKVEIAGSATASIIKLRRIAGVWTFYALINFWNLKTTLPIAERLRGFLWLFGL